MKPYAFYKLILNHTKERDNAKFLGARLSQAKKVLNHLSIFGWTDQDIIISIGKMCESLTNTGRPCSFAYICGVFMKTTSRPFNKSTSEGVTSTFADWVEAEIQRVRGNNA